MFWIKKNVTVVIGNMTAEYYSYIGKNCFPYLPQLK